MDKIDRIRGILLEIWDPIGVGSNCHLRDEYDAYIPRISRMIDDSSSIDDIVKELLSIENEMGLDCPEESSAIATALALTEK